MNLYRYERALRGARCIVGMRTVWLLLLAGCATLDPPKPWEKGDLARPSMRFDADPLAVRAAAHVYQSKEGAAAGGTVGGGGCGCN